MKYWLMTLLFLCSTPLFAQQDIVVPGAGPFFAITSNAQPGLSGGGGLNNNFILSPANNSLGFCVQITNTAGGAALSSNLTVSQTSDPSVLSYQGSTGGWTLTTSANISLGPSQSLNYFIPVSGGAKYVFTFSGATATGKANISAVQTSGCFSQNPSSLVSTFAFVCPLRASQTVATATTVKLVSLVQATGNIHVCAYSITVGGAAVAAARNLFIGGSGATCGTNTVTRWTIQTGTTTAQVFQLATSGGQIFDGQIGQDLCYTDAGTTAGSEVSIAYAIF